MREMLGILFIFSSCLVLYGMDLQGDAEGSKDVNPIVEVAPVLPDQEGTNTFVTDTMERILPGFRQMQDLDKKVKDPSNFWITNIFKPYMSDFPILNCKDGEQCKLKNGLLIISIPFLQMSGGALFLSKPILMPRPSRYEGGYTFSFPPTLGSMSLEIPVEDGCDMCLTCNAEHPGGFYMLVPFDHASFQRI
ncbi:MAG: hypothetical protein LBQ08_01000 [Holosporaceae bacterium]|jgi:hypothetical protein|nr:hypothetical protein [Holosporaceae bacterium]